MPCLEEGNPVIGRGEASEKPRRAERCVCGSRNQRHVPYAKQNLLFLEISLGLDGRASRVRGSFWQVLSPVFTDRPFGERRGAASSPVLSRIYLLDLRTIREGCL